MSLCVARLFCAQVEAELTEIGRVQAVVERLEAKLGRAHPQVGGWVGSWLHITFFMHWIIVCKNNSTIFFVFPPSQAFTTLFTCVSSPLNVDVV